MSGPFREIEIERAGVWTAEPFENIKAGDRFRFTTGDLVDGRVWVAHDSAVPIGDPAVGNWAVKVSQAGIPLA